ncbi:MAG TPA: MbtH family NRPS accessory protein [Allosphingosinicella sp.]|nr:MbtH family NRPS accessory protein [Allosphingosinicella sp.]
MDDEETEGTFCVLVNEEGQYSLWPEFKSIPAGWSGVGHSGSREACMAYVDAHWLDMRPRSLREQMDA